MATKLIVAGIQPTSVPLAPVWERGEGWGGYLLSLVGRREPTLTTVTESEQDTYRCHYNSRDPMTEHRRLPLTQS